MFRAASVLALLILATCGGPAVQHASGPTHNQRTHPYRLSDGTTTTDLNVWERDNAAATARFNARGAKQTALTAVPKAAQVSSRTINVSSQKMKAYQSAVADTLRDPESARFRSVRVIREADGSDALCGELNAKNAYGGYIGYEPFYAPVVAVKDKAVAVLWSPSRVGLETVLEKCGRS